MNDLAPAHSRAPFEIIDRATVGVLATAQQVTYAQKVFFFKPFVRIPLTIDRLIVLSCKCSEPSCMACNLRAL
eukprot:35323-Eustigmatos_ZCMA.PRE.1